MIKLKVKDVTGLFPYFEGGRRRNPGSVEAM
jgi:hypothetical protein